MRVSNDQYLISNEIGADLVCYRNNTNGGNVTSFSSKPEWRCCKDGLITSTQSRYITDSETKPKTQQMFTKQSYHPNPAKVYYWLRISPRVSNCPYLQVQSRSTQTINKCKAIYTPNQTMNKAFLFAFSPNLFLSFMPLCRYNHT